MQANFRFVRSLSIRQRISDLIPTLLLKREENVPQHLTIGYWLFLNPFYQKTTA